VQVQLTAPSKKSFVHRTAPINCNGVQFGERNPKSDTKLNPNLTFNSNRKTNLNPKSNPNLNLQKTLKKNLKNVKE